MLVSWPELGGTLSSYSNGWSEGLLLGGPRRKASTLTMEYLQSEEVLSVNRKGML